MPGRGQLRSGWAYFSLAYPLPLFICCLINSRCLFLICCIHLYEKNEMQIFLNSISREGSFSLEAVAKISVCISCWNAGERQGFRLLWESRNANHSFLDSTINRRVIDLSKILNKAFSPSAQVAPRKCSFCRLSTRCTGNIMRRLKVSHTKSIFLFTSGGIPTVPPL